MHVLSKSARLHMKSIKFLLAVLITMIFVVSISSCGESGGNVGNTGSGKTTGSLTGSGK